MISHPKGVWAYQVSLLNPWEICPTSTNSPWWCSGVHPHGSPVSPRMSQACCSWGLVKGCLNTIEPLTCRLR